RHRVFLFWGRNCRHLPGINRKTAYTFGNDMLFPTHVVIAKPPTLLRDMVFATHVVTAKPPTLLRDMVFATHVVTAKPPTLLRDMLIAEKHRLAKVFKSLLDRAWGIYGEELPLEGFQAAFSGRVPPLSGKPFAL
ncbi:hypothetical protein ACQ3G6_17905, partial [Allorhizobium undicola]|uniref:hypothetical protein n=1 Tax=Allorhizobium undicola TaxID=78527 RepID=UPI003D33578D